MSLKLGEKTIAKIFEESEKAFVISTINKAYRLETMNHDAFAFRESMGEKIVNAFAEQGLHIVVFDKMRFEIWTKSGAIVSGKNYSALELTEWLKHPVFYFQEEKE